MRARDIVDTCLSKLFINGVAEEKIYTLVEAVVAAEVYTWSDEALVATYQKLFITQAAVCELYFYYEGEGTRQVIVTPTGVILEVRLHDHSDSFDRGGCNDDSHAQDNSEIVESEDRYTPNFEFYMNEDNFLSATTENVSQLLEKFWSRYHSYIAQDDAYAVLGVMPSSSWREVRTQYRALAAKYHPDRGGDSEKFIEVRRAYESLKKIYAGNDIKPD